MTAIPATLDIIERPPLAGPDIHMEQVGPYELRVARWRMDGKADLDPQLPPLLFFGGIGANLEIMAPLADALDDRPMVMFDMPGIGGSPDPVIPYAAPMVAGMAATLMKRLDMGRADIMGFSWGGAMAQQFAAQHPGHVDRLVLAGTGPGMLMIPGDPRALGAMADPSTLSDPAFLERNFGTIFGGALGGMTSLSALAAPSATGFLCQLMAMATWTSAPLLPLLPHRTLVLSATEDRLAPPINGQMLAAMIPGAEHHVVRGAGHMFLLSHLDTVGPVLRSFLAR